MGYWGYKATESDSALDYMSTITEHLEKLWDGSTDHGERMAVAYVLTEAPDVDMTDYTGLKTKVATYLSNYVAMLNDRNADGERQEQIDYLEGLRSKLYFRQGTSLLDRGFWGIAVALP